MVSQLVKKFAPLYGIRSFITAFTRACHLSVCWATWNHSTFSKAISLRFTLILSYHLSHGLLSDLFPPGFPTKLCIQFTFHYTCHIPRQSHAAWFYNPNNFCEEYRSRTLSPCIPLQPLITSLLLFRSIFLSLLFSLSKADQVSHPHKTQAETRVLYISILDIFILDIKRNDKRCWTE